MNDDIARWAARYGVPFRFNPHFPINTLTLMRGATGLQLRAAGATSRATVEVVSRAMWERAAQPRRPGACWRATLAAAGFDADAFTALVGRSRGRRRG